jgi:hypothetical protein
MAKGFAIQIRWRLGGWSWLKTRDQSVAAFPTHAAAVARRQALRAQPAAEHVASFNVVHYPTRTRFTVEDHEA